MGFEIAFNEGGKRTHCTAERAFSVGCAQCLKNGQNVVAVYTRTFAPAMVVAWLRRAGGRSKVLCQNMATWHGRHKVFF